MRSVENQEINFVEARVTVVVEMRFFTVVNPTFIEFHHDEVFEEAAAVVDAGESLGGRNLAQPGR